MKIINIRKDGTIVDDLSNITVPKEIVESVVNMLKKKGSGKDEKAV